MIQNQFTQNQDHFLWNQNQSLVRIKNAGIKINSLESKSMSWQNQKSRNQNLFPGIKINLLSESKEPESKSILWNKTRINFCPRDPGINFPGIKIISPRIKINSPGIKLESISCVAPRNRNQSGIKIIYPESKSFVSGCGHLIDSDYDPRKNDFDSAALQSESFSATSLFNKGVIFTTDLTKGIFLQRC